MASPPACGGAWPCWLGVPEAKDSDMITTACTCAPVLILPHASQRHTSTLRALISLHRLSHTQHPLMDTSLSTMATPTLVTVTVTASAAVTTALEGATCPTGLAPSTTTGSMVICTPALPGWEQKSNAGLTVLAHIFNWVIILVFLAVFGGGLLMLVWTGVYTVGVEAGVSSVCRGAC